MDRRGAQMRGVAVIDVAAEEVLLGVQAERGTRAGTGTASGERSTALDASWARRARI
jgi:hypothetical protein